MTRSQTLGLVVLSFLSSATWFIGDLLPLEGPPLAGEGFRLLLCAVITFCLMAYRPRAEGHGTSTRQAFQAAAVSLGVLALPTILINAARGRIASTDGVLIFAMMPVATILMTGWMRSDQDSLVHLPPVLLGGAGVMILLPVSLPAGGEGVLGACFLVAAMLLTAASMIWLHLLLRGLSLRAAIPIIFLLNGLVLSLAGNSTGWGMSPSALWPHGLRAILFDLPQVVLLVWLLQGISPQRLASRYLAATLFTVVEGLFLVRPHVDFRTMTGLSLLAIGTGAFMFSTQSPGTESLRLNLRGTTFPHRPHSGGDGRS